VGAVSNLFRAVFGGGLGLLLMSCSPGEAPQEDPWDNQTIRENCFPDVGDPTAPAPAYDDFEPVVGRHCSGTNHQDISGVEKVVYLGDSVTEGTWPTLEEDFYRSRLTVSLEAEYGGIEVDRCSAYGARTDDLLREPHQQILSCFPDVELKTTLVVMTIGGNDMFAAAEDLRDGVDADSIAGLLDQAYLDLEDAIRWFDDHSERFPNGVFVIFSNIYEYTDATGDMGSCPTAEILGFPGQVPEMRDAYVWINEQYMRLAVQTQRDMLFSLEQFCGHGFFNEDPNNECYRGPSTERWFDDTCIHPTPAGHTQIAKMFMDVVLE
jgi:lysophospholipase L1-like esterase